MTWYQLSVTTSKNNATQVSDYFSTLGALAVTFSDATDQPIYEPPPGETRIWDQTVTTALFDSDTNLDKIQAFIRQQMADEDLQFWQKTTLQDQVWERSWMDHFHPMQFGDRLWICPSTQTPPDPEAMVVTLDPGLAFGTGTHATTALCLEWLDQHDLVDKVVIDYGCGSGILALAALKLGAKAVYAVDIDPQALIATNNNAVNNQLQQKLFCSLPEQLPKLKAELLIANILAEPLIKLASTLSSQVATEGQLILSGILADQVANVNAAYTPYFWLSEAVNKEGWIRLNGTKRPT